MDQCLAECRDAYHERGERITKYCQLSSFGLKEYGNGFRIDRRRLKLSGIGRVAPRAKSVLRLQALQVQVAKQRKDFLNKLAHTMSHLGGITRPGRERGEEHTGTGETRLSGAKFINGWICPAVAL